MVAPLRSIAYNHPKARGLDSQLHEELRPGGPRLFTFPTYSGLEPLHRRSACNQTHTHLNHGR